MANEIRKDQTKIESEALSINAVWSFLQQVNFGSNGLIKETSGDTLIQNTSATDDILMKLGDASGVTKWAITDSGDAVVAYIDSDGAIVNQISQDGVLDLTNASDVLKVKINSNGDTYFLGGNVGIGQIPAADKFEVAGNSTITGTVTFSSLNTADGIVQTDGSGVLSSSVTLPDGTLATTQSPSDNSTKIATTAYVDAAVLVEDLWDRVAGTPNYLLPNTAADDIGATGARITKGWFTDIESTNMPTVGGTSINANGVLSLTSTEVTQLANINAIPITSANWGHLSEMDQDVATTDSPSFDSVTVTGGGGDQDYLIDSAGTILIVQGQTSGNQSQIAVFTKDGDGTDSTVLSLYANGTPADTSNSEFFSLSTDVAASDINIRSQATGGGTVRNIKAWTGTNLNQLVLKSDGTVGIGKIPATEDFEIQGDMRIVDADPYLHFEDTTDQDYRIIVSNDSFNVQGMATSTAGIVSLSSNDADGTDDSFLHIYGVGHNPSDADVEYLRIGWNAATNRFNISPIEDGTGTLRPLTIFTEGNTNQIYVATNGNVGLNADSPSQQLVINGDLGIKRTASAIDYNPSALTTDYLIAITDTSVARAVTISTEDIQSGSTANPRVMVVKDESGNAATNNITVSGETGNIDGAANFAIASDHGSITIYADGTNLWIV
jgi:hypothetical protein